MTRHRGTGLVPADHPCLPGHFPGNPIVPAVVLLEHVERALREAVGAPLRLTALPTVKFLSPLAPGVGFEILLDVDGSHARFSCRTHDRDLVRGRLEFARE